MLSSLTIKMTSFHICESVYIVLDTYIPSITTCESGVRIEVDMQYPCSHFKEEELYMYQ